MGSSKRARRRRRRARDKWFARAMTMKAMLKTINRSLRRWQESMGSLAAGMAGFAARFRELNRPRPPELNPGIPPGKAGKPPGFGPAAADNRRPGL